MEGRMYLAHIYCTYIFSFPPNDPKKSVLLTLFQMSKWKPIEVTLPVNGRACETSLTDLPKVISSRKPFVTPSARTAAPHTCGGPIHIDDTVDGTPGAMPFGGSRDSSLLCVLMVLVVIQLLSCPTLNSSMDCNTPGFPVFIISQSLFILLSIELMMPSNHLILCYPLRLLPSIFPSFRLFSIESVLCIKWPKHWSFGFSVSPSNEYWGLISVRIDWFDLLAVPGTLKSLLQHHSSKASILWRSAFVMVQLSHPLHDSWEKSTWYLRSCLQQFSHFALHPVLKCCIPYLYSITSRL